RGGRTRAIASGCRKWWQDALFQFALTLIHISLTFFPLQSISHCAAFRNELESRSLWTPGRRALSKLLRLLARGVPVPRQPDRDLLFLDAASSSLCWSYRFCRSLAKHLLSLPKRPATSLPGAH